ncbi:hypothetical protein PybrP1_004787 [[Pythium] brassicae (nom. inval.)]|nr:hypothetical protein PybrP1_004787 [[Pythium] brassicae (nom. inval.)]
MAAARLLLIAALAVAGPLLAAPDVAPPIGDAPVISHFTGLRELSGKGARAFGNRFRRHLGGVQCLRYHAAGHWWHYEWCVDGAARQFHPESGDAVVLGRVAAPALRVRPVANLARLRDPDQSGYIAQQTYARGDACGGTEEAQNLLREAEIHYKCCAYRANETYIEMVEEPATCKYTFTVCTPAACGLMHKDQYALGASMRVSEEERLVLADTVKEMFYHAYYGYLENAYPLDALLPISCRGETFELGKIQMLTLIDTLDTLAILEDAKEFQHAVKLVVSGADFNLDTEVSVFETTIRVLGGLLSAHLFAANDKLALFPPGAYKNELLELAVDLGDRLMPAFETATGIPYGTVNLRHGVPRGETPIASTAGAGSLSMEFTMLSVLTREPKYANAARGAVRALFERRSSLGLLGKHIDTRSGEWTESVSGPGSNSDSFYEYLFKMYMTYNDEESLAMFASVYPAVLQHNLHGDWYADVSMWTGCGHGGVVFENLAAFWPGTQASVGHFQSATKSMNSFYRVWRDFGFIPEQFNVLDWKPLRGRGSRYPLRPELIESTFYMHEATQDSSWLRAGAHFVHSLQKHAKTTCGYATIADIETKAQEDNMPSFFLSETCKYLYLLFNTTHFFRDGGYVMTTEAHPFPILPAKLVDPIIFAAQLANRTQQQAAEASGGGAAAQDAAIEPPFVSRSSYSMSQLQCVPPQFLDPFNYQVGYESAVVAKTARCQPAPAPAKKGAPVAAAPTTEVVTEARGELGVTKGSERLESWLENRLGTPLGELKQDSSVTLDGLVELSSSSVGSGDDAAAKDDDVWIQRLLNAAPANAPSDDSAPVGKKAFKTIYGGAKFGHFRIDQLETTMRFTREDTGDWIETVGMDDAAQLLVSTGKEQRLDLDGVRSVRDFDDADAELEFTTHLVYQVKYDLSLPIERTCRLNVLVSSQSAQHPGGLRYSFPCVGAGFGVTDKLQQPQTFAPAELELATPLDACGWLANDDVRGKVVLATRGVCFFENKARNAARRGAAGVIIANNEDYDRVMVMGGSNSEPSESAEGHETLEIPVVMVPQRLGAWFERQQRVAADNNEQLTVAIELSVRDTTIAIDPRASRRRVPFVEGTTADLRVFGAEWGVHLRRSGKEGDPQELAMYSIAIVETPASVVDGAPVTAPEAADAGAPAHH